MVGRFSSGESSLRALQENLYDAVKIDNFFKIYSKSGIWPIIIKNIMRYCNFIIIEGLESTEKCHAIEKDIKAYRVDYLKSHDLKISKALIRNSYHNSRFLIYVFFTAKQQRYSAHIFCQRRKGAAAPVASVIYFSGYWRQ
ncbi:hypothetical protein ABIE06_003385 [Pantoea dispersa]|uniref:hypothetical protein n=1 Tax=Pantoea dispersa TaxID=59814 RepID=UPI003D1930C9